MDTPDAPNIVPVSPMTPEQSAYLTDISRRMEPSPEMMSTVIGGPWKRFVVRGAWIEDLSQQRRVLDVNRSSVAEVAELLDLLNHANGDPRLLAAHKGVSEGKSVVITGLEKRIETMKSALSALDLAISAYYEGRITQGEFMEQCSDAFGDAGMECAGPDHYWPEDQN